MTPEQLRRLAGPEGSALFALIGPHDPDRVLAVAERAAQAGFEADLVAAALTQVRLRARAAADLGDRASTMFFTDAGLQQATRWQVARLHAERFRAAGVRRVVDLGCGIGVDALAMLQAGLSVVGYERDATTAAVAEANLSLHAAVAEANLSLPACTEQSPGATGSVVQADVVTAIDSWSEQVDRADGAWFDPARRRPDGRRIFDPRQASPPLSFIEQVATRLVATGAKVAPGIDHELVPDGAQAQWISVDGDLVEATLWFGAARLGCPDEPTDRSALLLHRDADGTQQQTLVVADDSRPEVAPVRQFLLEPDPAIIRAGALGRLARLYDATTLDPTIAYLGSDRAVNSPAVRSYRVLDVMPFSLKRLRSYLREREVGAVTIKKRGTAVEPERLRSQLKLQRRKGAPEATVVLTRVAGRQSVLIVDPC